MDCHSCENCGCFARIVNLEHENNAQWEEMKTMKKAIDCTKKRFTQILITLLGVALVAIANLGYMILHTPGN